MNGVGQAAERARALADPGPLRPLAGGRVDVALLRSLQGLEWKARYVMEGFLGGRHESPFHGLSVEFRDYRDYQPGDDPRHVDWRLYARSDRLSVKRYEHETSLRAYLLVDTSASMGYRGARAWGSKLEVAHVLAFALGLLFSRQNDAVGLLALEGQATPRPGAEGQRAGVLYLRPAQAPYQAGLLLRELEALEARGAAGLETLLAHAARLAHRRSLVVLLTDLLDPVERVRDGLRRLRFDGHECAVLQVLDADELDFPFDDAAVFEDPETGERRAVDARRARDAYRARFAAFQSEWAETLRDLELHHALVRTDEPPGAALARAVRARRRLT